MTTSPYLIYIKNMRMLYIISQSITEKDPAGWGSNSVLKAQGPEFCRQNPYCKLDVTAELVTPALRGRDGTGRQSLRLMAKSI